VRNPQKHRKAATLLELIIIILVIGILASLGILAAQQARDSARALNCMSNLKQIGLAMINYESTYRCFPSPGGLATKNEMRPKQFSVHSKILNFLEGQNVYDSINFSVKHQDPFLFEEISHVNTTVQYTSIAVFLCPSDRKMHPSPGTNYRFNIGTERWVVPNTNANCGPLGGYRSLSTTASLRDGLTNTALCSEKVKSNDSTSKANLRSDLPIGRPLTIVEAYNLCRDSDMANAEWVGQTGLSWITSSLGQTLYNHIIEPNSEFNDCGKRTNPLIGLIGARSNHASTSNTLMVDGSARSIRSGLNINVWRSLGTASGGELDQSY